MTEYATLECVEPFFQGKELVRGCKVGVTENRRRYFYMIYTKYRKNAVNYSILEESGDQESWGGPLIVMRLDVASATRLVSITSKSHRDIAIQAVAKLVLLATALTACSQFVSLLYTRFTRIMNSRISASTGKRLRWPQVL